MILTSSVANRTDPADLQFRLKARSGQVVATGAAYKTKNAAKKGCEAVQNAAAGATIVESDS